MGLYHCVSLRFDEALCICLLLILIQRAGVLLNL